MNKENTLEIMQDIGLLIMEKEDNHILYVIKQGIALLKLLMQDLIK